MSRPTLTLPKGKTRAGPPVWRSPDAAPLFWVPHREVQAGPVGWILARLYGPHCEVRLVDQQALMLDLAKTEDYLTDIS